ncbi:hypothetical protein Q5705_13450 [Kosakonia sp. H02]|nr:hypothetical protein Q5705_13450 [Kosakonia sp. H02]
MKWHPAIPNKRSFFLLLSALIALAFGYVLHSAQATLKQTGETSQQFGFYDLLLQKNELYDSRMSTVGNMIVSTISNPAHPEFTLKSNFIQSRQQRGNTISPTRRFILTPRKIAA